MVKDSALTMAKTNTTKTNSGSNRRQWVIWIVGYQFCWQWLEAIVRWIPRRSTASVFFHLLTRLFLRWPEARASILLGSKVHPPILLLQSFGSLCVLTASRTLKNTRAVFFTLASFIRYIFPSTYAAPLRAKWHFRTIVAAFAGMCQGIINPLTPW